MSFLLNAHVYIDIYVCVCRVLAENDFLHTLLTKVTTSRGDSGGQGKTMIPASKYMVLNGIIFLSYRFITALHPTCNPPNRKESIGLDYNDLP